MRGLGNPRRPTLQLSDSDEAPQAVSPAVSLEASPLQLSPASSDPPLLSPAQVSPSESEDGVVSPEQVSPPPS